MTKCAFNKPDDIEGTFGLTFDYWFKVKFLALTVESLNFPKVNCLSTKVTRSNDLL